MVNMSFPGKIIINVNAKKLCVSGKMNNIAVNYYQIFISINTFFLVWNSIATVLFTFMCNLLNLSHYHFRHFHINGFYYVFCVGIFIKNASNVSIKKEL